MTAHGSAPGTQGAERAGIEPVRDPRVTLVELVDTLLDRGLYLNLDVLISVADIPLIGLNLRATLAGMETMLEYGMMRDWDQRTRAWVQKTSARDLPLREDEELLAKMPGGYFSRDDFHRDWRPGSVYLTTSRLLVFRRDPREVLWEAELTALRGAEIRAERTIGGEMLERLHLREADGGEAVLSASSPRRLRELVLQQAPAAARTLPADGSVAEDPTRAGDGHRPTGEDAVEGHLWYREDLAGRSAWRGGSGRLDEAGFVWKSAMDTRPAIRLRPGQLREVHLEDGQVPSGDSRLLRLETTAGEFVLAGDVSRWQNPLRDLAGRLAPTTDDKEA
jgi:hypothetical protein